MDQFQNIKTRWKEEGYVITEESEALRMCDDVEYLISEIERLRTVEQAYQALLSATAGQKK